MSAFTVDFSPAAVRNLKRINPQVRLQLLRAAAVLEFNPYPTPDGRIKPLIGISPPHFRLRVGEYRIIYRIFSTKVIILRVAHRREAYR